MKVRLPKGLSGYLSGQTQRLHAYLGTPSRWGKEGPLEKRWRLVINMPRQELLGEVHIG